jgi:hypothetical protein
MPWDLDSAESQRSPAYVILWRSEPVRALCCAINAYPRDLDQLWIASRASLVGYIARGGGASGSGLASSGASTRSRSGSRSGSGLLEGKSVD